MTPRVCCILVTLLLCASMSLTQQSNSARTDFLPLDPGMVLLKSDLLLKKQVNEVNLVLSVTDRKGHFVNGLGAGDFSILDNDLRQTKITFFQNQTDLPLDIAVVLDASASVGARFDAEQHAITQFLHQTIRHEDSAVLFVFNKAIRVIAPINYNWRDLSRRLKKVKPDGETALYDAVSTAADHLSQNSWPARRIIILVSDGEENRSRTTPSGTAAAVLKAGAVVCVPLGPREAAVIMTGAPVPAGADAVVMVEYTTVDGNFVEITKSVEPGERIVAQGAEAIRGGELLAKGEILEDERPMATRKDQNQSKPTQQRPQHG